MTFGDAYSPTRSMTQLAPPVKVRTPASQRPKGSFMNPTASKMLKQISKADLLQSQGNLTVPEKLTFSKRRATEQAYGYSSPYDNYQKTLKALEETNKDKESPVRQSPAAARPQSAFVAKTQAKPVKHKKLSQKNASTKNLARGILENPELAEDSPVANIRVNSASKPERPVPQMAPTHERVQKMREETERMEKEFKAIEGDL